MDIESIINILTVNHLGGFVQNISYDFLKLLILLPIAIVLDLIIKTIRERKKKNESEKSSKTTKKKTQHKGKQ